VFEGADTAELEAPPKTDRRPVSDDELGGSTADIQHKETAAAERVALQQVA
jgi:hypothetical protein